MINLRKSSLISSIKLYKKNTIAIFSDIMCALLSLQDKRIMLSTLSPQHSQRLTSIGSSKAWFVCFSAALFFFYEFIQMHMFNAINDTLRVAFDASATELGFLSSTYLLADLIFLLPAGILLDRYSTRTIILYAIFVCIIGTLGFALSHSFVWAGIFHFLSGIGNAFCFLSCIMLVSRWFPANRQALVVGLVVTIAFLGGMAAQTPLAWLAEILGWRQSLILDAMLGVAIMGLIYWQVQDSPGGKKTSPDKDKQQLLTELACVVKNKQNWLAGVYTCLLNLPIMVLCAVWGKNYLEIVYHLNTTQATNVTSLIFLGSIIGCPLAGFISDSLLTRKLPMLLGATFSLITICLITAGFNLGYSTLACLFFLLGFFTSTQVISYPFVGESNPPELTGTGTGLASLIIMGGAGVAQVVFGALLDWNWDGLMANGARVYSAIDFQFAMKMFPISIIIALVAIAAANETFCRAKQARS
jgi:MFS family permease